MRAEVVRECLNLTEFFIEKNWPLVERVAQKLREKHVLSGDDISLLATGTRTGGKQHAHRAALPARRNPAGQPAVAVHSQSTPKARQGDDDRAARRGYTLPDLRHEIAQCQWQWIDARWLRRSLFPID